MNTIENCGVLTSERLSLPPYFASSLPELSACKSNVSEGNPCVRICFSGLLPSYGSRNKMTKGTFASLQVVSARAR
jgi:hypothetical protein